MSDEKCMYYVHASSDTLKRIGEYLEAQGVVVEDSTTTLEVASREYVCREVSGKNVHALRQFVKDNPHSAESVLLFELYEGQGKNARDVSFMLRGSRRIRQAVLMSLTGHSPRGVVTGVRSIMRRSK